MSSSPISVAESFAGTARFQIVRQLGAGGMGVVYEAFDTERGQKVALKTLKQIDPTAVYRFKHEFRSLTELVHPNLVPLYELISDGEQWFFVMELIEGAVDFLQYVRSESTRSLPTDIIAQSAPLSTEALIPSSNEPATAAWTPGASNSAKPSTKVVQKDAFAATVDRASQSSMTDQTTPLASPADTETVKVQPVAAISDAHEKTVTGSSAPQDIHDETIISPPIEDTASAGSASSASAASTARPSVMIRDFARLRSAFRQLCAGVRALHVSGKLHRDLKPGNVLVSAAGTVVLLDFGLVAEMSTRKLPVTDGRASLAGGLDPAQLSHSSTDRQIAGTIGFMSPEQAAGRNLTEASDWYAVGVMLFQALTGRLPITGKPIQILAQKQIQNAPAPADIVDGVPDDLNALCVRLLQRDPAKRPTGTEVVAVFAQESASSTVTSIDQMPQSMPFIGRERHLSELNAAFDEMLAGAAIVCRVHGRSGVGKSTLIQHYLDELSHHKQAVILTGRCYEQESVPYKGVDSLIDALTQFLRQPTTKAAGLIPVHVAALARIFPVLKRVEPIEAACREQAVASDLRELRRDAFQAFRDLLSCIGRRHPLVIYLDDLQWGDADSAALLTELLGAQDAPRMLVLMSYRSEYADVSECLKSLSAAQTSGTSRTRWRELKVEALAADETRELARRLLRADRPNREASADRIVQQSGGSAYFVYELARHLNAGMDLAAVSGTNLDDVLWSRVSRLPDEAQRFLHMVAVAGQPTRLRNILEASRLQTVSPRLMATLRVEHLIRSSGPGLQAEIEAFHDRIRESVVNHLSPDARRGHHGELALSLERTTDADPETIAGHFEGAGHFAKASHYYVKAADQAVQVLAFDRAEGFYKQAVRLAQSDVTRAEAYERLIHFLTDMARFADAYAVGREAVQLFGVTLPKGFVPPLFIIDFLKAKLRIGWRSASQLLDLPVMTDQRLSTAVRLTNAVAKAAYQVRPELCVAVSTKIVNLCLKYGNTPDSAIVWMVFGAIFQGGVMGNHPLGYEYGRLALSLVDKYQQERQRPEVTFVVGYFGTSWLRPATEAEALWRTTYESGRATGDLFHTGCACAGTTQSLFMRGVKLDEVWADSDRFLNFLRSVNLREPIGAIESVRQAIRNLRGQTLDHTTFTDGNGFDEAAYASTLAGYGSRHFAHFYFVNKMLAQYLWQQYDAALATSQASAKYLKESPGMLHSAEHHFLTALIHAALADRATGSARSRLVRSVRSGGKRLQKWAARCPHNFEHKAQLLAGELARLTGATPQAEQAYAAAIRAAAQFGYRHIEAISHQQAARFHSQVGPRDKASAHQARATECFTDWGATAHWEATS